MSASKLLHRSTAKTATTIPGHQPDRRLLSTIFLLLGVGLVLLFSASSVAGYLRSGNSYYFIEHQLAGLVLGLPAFFILSRWDYHRFRKHAFAALIASFVLVLLVFIPGLGAHYGKAQNWINLWGFSIQPAEFAKLSFFIYLAAWLNVKQERLESFSQGFGPFLAILGVLGFIMMLQPDLGTFSIIFSVSVVAYFVAGGSRRILLIMLGIALLGLFLVMSVKSNKMERFDCFRDPEAYSQDKCYQINQSLIAIGSGGWFGRGLGESRQKFMYLPEVWSDSVFAVIAEEIGFVFSVLLLILYFYLFYLGIQTARRAPDDFGRLLATCIVCWVMFQTLINIGGISNLIPMTGVPLPFVSSGGSSIAALMAAMGILVNISRYTRS